MLAFRIYVIESKNMIALACVLVLVISLSQSCPLSEDLYPCSCKMESDTADILCSGLNNEHDLINAATALKWKNNIYSFTIENSNFNYIPHDTFTNVRFQELEIKTSFLLALTDTDEAFVGLENTLDILLINGCTFMNSWDWAILRNHRKLMRIDIVEGDLEQIDETITEISYLNMKDISFANNQISYIYSKAFANFTELMVLTLSHNLISEVKRSMIPDPAFELRQIDLSYNEIENFPEDMFQNMPNLEWLNIGSNKILTLNEKIFSPIWQQLNGFSTLGNKLRCDCRMAWILDRAYPKNLRAVCAEPKEVRGHSLKTLTAKTLWC